MKETILTCDRCKVSIPAATTLHLSNGRGKPINLDVCKKHQAEVLKIFVPVRRVGSSGPMTEDDWVNFKDSTLRYVNDKGKTTSVSMQQDTGASIWHIRKALKELVKERKIKRTGIGPGSSYHRR